MTQSISHIQTEKASRYLQQLCKHFGHKIPVEFDEQQGTMTFPFGTCTLKAEEAQLTLTVSGEDTDKLEKVVGSHLERFAFREALSVTWAPSVD